MENEKYPTTAEHFEIFKTECEYWIGRLGLKGWLISINHRACEKPSWLAQTGANLVARSAAIDLNTEWLNIEPTEAELRRSGFHEVCEVLFSRVEAVGDSRLIGPDELREAVHEVIRTMENVFWRAEYQRLEKGTEEQTGH